MSGSLGRAARLLQDSVSSAGRRDPTDAATRPHPGSVDQRGARPGLAACGGCRAGDHGAAGPARAGHRACGVRERSAARVAGGAVPVVGRGCPDPVPGTRLPGHQDGSARPTLHPHTAPPAPSWALPLLPSESRRQPSTPGPRHRLGPGGPGFSDQRPGPRPQAAGQLGHPQRSRPGSVALRAAPPCGRAVGAPRWASGVDVDLVSDVGRSPR